jgi:hypothetical protein
MRRPFATKLSPRGRALAPQKSGNTKLLLSNLALEVEPDYRAPYLALEVPTVLWSSLAMPSITIEGVARPAHRS